MTKLSQEQKQPIALYQNQTSLLKNDTQDLNSVIKSQFPKSVDYEERKKAEAERAAQEAKKAEEEAKRQQEESQQQTNTVPQIPQYAGDKIVTLTFDDGPGYGSTERILNVLAQYNIKATFFVLGQKVAQNPAMLQRIIAEGHTVGSHSYDHPDLATLSLDAAQQQMDATDQQIIAAGGQATRYMRPPYGSYSDALRQHIQKKEILWNVDSNDWRNKQNPQATVNNVMSSLNQNSLILFHDIYDSSASAVEMIIPQLLANGYRFVSLDEYIQLTGY
ncbi:hypothetical protein A4S06_02320 [Erysipelotrichaceae bacterium MTC7]|nr:hypothetical protein A4S06_02320 [Erysipelotrichaceae bacterium MTC7]